MFRFNSSSHRIARGSCGYLLAGPALIAGLSALLAAPLPAHAAGAATQPSTSPSAGAAINATITEVKGLVQVRLAEDQPWQPAKVGAALGAGAEFRTGPHSAVTFKIPPDQVVTLDRLGTLKLIEAVRLAENQVKTDLGMKYGRTIYQVEGAGVEHDCTIRSPASTLAVRGTESFGFQSDQLGEQMGSVNTTLDINHHNGPSNSIGGPGQIVEIGGPNPQLPPTNNQFQDGSQSLSNNATSHALGGQSGANADFITTASSIVVRLFEGGQNEGDRVRLNYNQAALGAVILLTNVGQQVPLDLQDGTNTLKILGVFTPASGPDISGKLELPVGGTVFDVNLSKGTKPSDTATITKAPGFIH